MNNNGRIGEAKYLKFSNEKLSFLCNSELNYEDGYVISIEEAEKELGALISLPIHIDKTTKDDYECVCEFGTEIHKFNN